MEVKATNTRQKFNCTTKDKIMYNGNCYQLTTQTFHKDWTELLPVISEKEFKRLVTEGALSEPYEKLSPMTGITLTMYDFVKE